jgi:signal transduction histidine kinase
MAYVLTAIPIAAPVTIALSLLGLPWVAATGRARDGVVPSAPVVVLMLIGPVVIAVLGPLAAVPIAAAERQRLTIVDPRPLTSAHRLVSGGVARWLRTRYTEPATWRELAYAFFLGVAVPVAYGMVLFLVCLDVVFLASPLLVAGDMGQIALGVTEVSTARQALPYALFGIALLPLLPYLVGVVTAGHVAVARALLGDGDATALREVARSRARLVDAFDAERRRIERDLHDGAQHRLTSLTLQLGIARMDLPDDSPAAMPLAMAHEQAKELMVVLRELIHGIRPQMLVELGLSAALQDLAGRAPMPVTVTVSHQLIGRLSELVESTAYFVASEALTNVAKHSGATRAEVTLSGTSDLLVLEVRDDGHGGADPGRSTGLTGLADRVAATGGRLLLASPAGGPTLVRVELPCRR